MKHWTKPKIFYFVSENVLTKDHSSGGVAHKYDELEQFANTRH